MMTKRSADLYLDISRRLRQEGATAQLEAAWRQAYKDLSANELASTEDVVLMAKLGLAMFAAAHDHESAVRLAETLLNDPRRQSLPEPHGLDVRCLLACALFCSGHEEQAIGEWTEVLREARRGYRRTALVAVRATLVEALLFCPGGTDDHAASLELRDLVGELLFRLVGRRRSAGAATAATSADLVDLLLSTWPDDRDQVALFHVTIDRASFRARGEYHANQ